MGTALCVWWECKLGQNSKVQPLSYSSPTSVVSLVKMILSALQPCQIAIIPSIYI